MSLHRLCAALTAERSVPQAVELQPASHRSGASPQRLAGYVNPDGSRRRNWTADGHGLLARVVANLAARTRAQCDEGDLSAAADLLRVYSSELRAAIMGALARPAPAHAPWRHARVPIARHRLQVMA